MYIYYRQMVSNIFLRPQFQWMTNESLKEVGRKSIMIYSDYCEM